MLSNSVIAWLSLTDFGLGVTVNKYIATYHAKRRTTGRPISWDRP